MRHDTPPGGANKTPPVDPGAVRFEATILHAVIDDLRRVSAHLREQRGGHLQSIQEHRAAVRRIDRELQAIMRRSEAYWDRIIELAERLNPEGMQEAMREVAR